MSREMYMLMFFGELGSTLNAAHMRFNLYHPCIDHLPMVYTMKQLHVLGMHMLMSCLARGGWLTDVHTLCAVHGFSLRVQLHSLGVTDTNIHIIIARMQPGLGCLALVYSAIISYRILYCSSLESNYQRF